MNLPKLEIFYERNMSKETVTKFSKAIQEGNLEQMRHYIQEGFNFNQKYDFPLGCVRK
jgi:hypothetical protein